MTPEQMCQRIAELEEALRPFAPTPEVLQAIQYIHDSGELYLGENGWEIGPITAGDLRRAASLLSAPPPASEPDAGEVERVAEQPAWGAWVDYDHAPLGSYACLVSSFVDGKWTEPESNWMPAQGRPALQGQVRVMPYLMPGDPLALSAMRPAIDREKIAGIRTRHNRVDAAKKFGFSHASDPHVENTAHADRAYLLSLIGESHDEG